MVRGAGPPGGVGFINAIPVSSAACPTGSAVRERGLPVFGDDFKSKSARRYHRVLNRLFMDRGVRIVALTSVLRGNTTSSTCSSASALVSKKILPRPTRSPRCSNEIRRRTSTSGRRNTCRGSRTQVVPSSGSRARRSASFPSTPESAEVWDSPNSAGVIIDAIRCLRSASTRAQGARSWPLELLHEVAAHQIPDDIEYTAWRRYPGRRQVTLRGTEESAEVSRRSRARQGQGVAPVNGPRPLARGAPPAASSPARPRVERAAICRLKARRRSWRTCPALSQALIGTAPRPSYLAWPAKRRFSELHFSGPRAAARDRRVASLALRAYRAYATYIVELMSMPSRPQAELAAGVRGRRHRPGRGGMVRVRAADDRGGGNVGKNVAIAAAIAIAATRQRRRERLLLPRAVPPAAGGTLESGACTSSRGATCGVFAVLRRNEIPRPVIDVGVPAGRDPVAMVRPLDHVPQARPPSRPRRGADRAARDPAHAPRHRSGSSSTSHSRCRPPAATCCGPRSASPDTLRR